MDRKAFKQRMQELKSYREQNPGKGYLDWKASKYVEGGVIPPERMEYKGKLYTDKNGRRYTEEQYQDYLKNSTDEISRFDGKPLVRGLKPVVDLEDAANITPVGDAIAIKDTYDAIRNNDWLGAGIAALTVLPFVPNSFGRTLGSRVRKAILEGVNLDVNPKIAHENINEPVTYPTTVKEFQNAIMKAPDSQKHMKDLLKLHVKPSILFRDFKNVPLVDNAKRNNNLVWYTIKRESQGPNIYKNEHSISNVSDTQL